VADEPNKPVDGVDPNGVAPNPDVVAGVDPNRFVPVPVPNPVVLGAPKDGVA
jgi:hypothetical protein